MPGHPVPVRRRVVDFKTGQVLLEHALAFCFRSDKKALQAFGEGLQGGRVGGEGLQLRQGAAFETGRQPETNQWRTVFLKSCQAADIQRRQALAQCRKLQGRAALLQCDQLTQHAAIADSSLFIDAVEALVETIQLTLQGFDAGGQALALALPVSGPGALDEERFQLLADATNDRL